MDTKSFFRGKLPTPSDFGSKGLKKCRQRAKDSMLSLDFPTRKHEEWKYTSLESLIESSYSFGQLAEYSFRDFESYKIPNLDAHYVFIVNGFIVKNDLSSSKVSNNCIVESFDSLAASSQKIVEDHFTSCCELTRDIFVSMNTRCFQNGLCIHVPDGVVVSKPICCVFISDPRKKNLVTFPRVFVNVGKGAELQIIEQYCTFSSGMCFENAMFEWSVSENAKLSVYRLQNGTKESLSVHNTFVKAQKGSSVSVHTYSFGGALMRNNVSLELLGEHAESNLFGLSLLSDSSHVDHHTFVDHRVPNCVSNELYKNVVDDKAIVVFNGKIEVRKGAQKTRAYQQSKSLLLTDDAKAYIKPQLEIYADDVKCSHGATTGQIDEDALFYIRSRGISEKQARALLLRAFAGEVIEKIEDDVLRGYLEGVIGNKFV